VEIELDINPGIFNDVYLPALNSEIRTQIRMGGSSSGKSYSEFTMAPIWAMQGHSILIVRRNASSISKSVWLQLKKSIKKMGLSEFFKIDQSAKTIECLVSTGCIVTAGIYPDTERLKSITPLEDDAFSKIIIEEATEITEDEYNDILLRQRGTCRFKKTVTLLFNPIFKKHWIYKKFFAPIEDEYDFNADAKQYISEDLWILKTTHLDNKFLEDEERKTLEGMKSTSPYHYQVYCKGNFGILGTLCLPNVIEREFDPVALRLESLGINIGIDFGFTNDPTAIVFTAYDERNRTVYVFDECGGKGMSEEAMVVGIKERLNFYGIRYYEAYADNSSPRIIDRLRSLGLNVNGAKGSIMDGIFWLNQNKILVRPKCTNVLEESKLYTYKKGTDGEVTNEPIDKYNHYVGDGLRYACVNKISDQKYIGSNKKF